MEFQEEKEFLERNEDRSNKVNRKFILSDEEALRLRNNYRHLPQEYIDYLLEIGAGIIRDVQFDVKPYLFDFKDLGLDDIFQADENIKFFGDNLSGDFAGFDLSGSDNEVIEFWHDSNEIFRTGKTFRRYIREKMLMNTS